MHDVAASDDASIGIDVVGMVGIARFVDGDGRSIGFDGKLLGILVQEIVPDRRYKAIRP